MGIRLQMEVHGYLHRCYNRPYIKPDDSPSNTRGGLQA